MSPAPLASTVAGVVLAAGTSSRMGRNKLLLTLDGETLVRGAARRALAGGLSPVIVVLGSEAERLAAELDGVGCQIATNPDFASGMASSLRTGVAAVPATSTAAMMLLADMPFVTAEMIGAMIGRYDETRSALVISDYAGVTAPPVLYDRSLFTELQAGTGDRGAQQVAERHRGQAQIMTWPAAALVDIDNPEDYARRGLYYR
jgi:molybdenum cofactor cytidylyltransferase